MIDEILLRDRVELERRRDEATRLDRINGVERDLAVLRTRFDAAFDSFLKELARSVSDDDLKILKRELEDKIKEALVAMHIEIETSNQQWAEKILAGAKILNAEAQVQRMEEQRRFRQQIMLAIFGAALSLFVGLIIFWETSRLH